MDVKTDLPKTAKVKGIVVENASIMKKDRILAFV